MIEPTRFASVFSQFNGVKYSFEERGVAEQLYQQSMNIYYDAWVIGALLYFFLSNIFLYIQSLSIYY